MKTHDKYADPAKGTRRAITASLLLGGAIAGAMVGLAVTPLGKAVSGAPPADMANYIRNAAVFGIMGACIAPVTVWTAMRNVPLWRAIAEPLAGGVLGAGLGAVLGSGMAFLALIPLGAGVAAARLAVSHRALDLRAGRLIGG